MITDASVSSPGNRAQFMVGEVPAVSGIRRKPLLVEEYILGELTELTLGNTILTAMAGHFDPDAPGVGSQFLEGARYYDAHYTDIESTIAKISGAMQRGRLTDLTPRLILDIGSGPGGSAFALVSLFSEAGIIASDLSPNMVALIQRGSVKRGLENRVSALVADASRLNLRAGSFDLIVGSSMLHHLIDPFAALENLLTGLAPGGMAVFYEPFQAGYVVMRQCMQEIIRRIPEHNDFDPAVADFLRVCMVGLDLMFDEGRTHPVLPTLDDKWLFTRRHFTAVADRLGLTPPAITSAHPPTRAWEEKIRTLLYAGMDRTAALPDWVTEILASCDRNISPALREELLMEGEVIFRRA
jgi:ubiquinone/menaquinone biosynthesis C-methylase UbiE